MLLSCLSKPRSSHKGCSNKSSVSVWTSLIWEIMSDAFSAISSNSMSSALAISDEEGSSACYSSKSKTNRGFKLVLAML